MARARNIKPGFFRNADLVELPAETRLFFIGLWTIADRAGRLEDRPKQIKMELFPADSYDCDAMLGALAATGMLARYEIDGKRYVQIVNFCKHQNPHKDEKASTIPDSFGVCAEPNNEPAKHSASTVQAPCKDDADSELVRLIPDSLIPEEKKEANASVTGKPVTVSAAQPQCPADDLINLYHELMPLNPPVKVLNDARRKAIRSRWKEAALLTCQPFGYANRQDGILAWRRFFEVCAESEFLTGRAKPTPGKPPFLADIDFLFSPSGFVRCLENKFHREVTV